MAAYLLARIKVTDPEAYQEYTKRTPAVIARFGGRFIVRGGRHTTLEGEASDAARIIVVEFPDYEQALACYNSPEYQEAKSYREHAAEAEFVLVEGV